VNHVHPKVKLEKKNMDWIQTFTIIGSMMGATYAFYHITDKRIDRMEEHHRDDIKRMDEKWERLFERLLLQDQRKER
jgi:hypothetical protein